MNPTSAAIPLREGKLEAQFVFFYDLKVKIVHPLEERIRRTEQGGQSEWFALKDVRRSELNRHYPHVSG